MTHQRTIYPRPWPHQFLADFDRTGAALWFFLYLLTRMDPKTGCCRGSWPHLAAQLGVSGVTLRAWLEQLEAEGYLRDESLNGKLVVRLADPAAGFRLGR